MLYSSVFHFAFLCIVHQSHGIEPLSRHTAPIDIINEVVNQIFSSLQLKCVLRESRIKEYSKMHKYFVSLARLHKNDIIEMLKITSLDIRIDNGTRDYTTIINEVLNDENKTEAVNYMLNEENVNKHIEDFLATLENVKQLYLRNNSSITVNYEILHRFHKNRHSLRNKTVDRLHLVQNDSGFWVPDGRRVYQGKRTKIKNFPFVASVHMFDQFTCAGSIIHADLVITAASCLQLAHNNRFYRENPSYLSVRIGSSTYAGGDRVPVLEVYFYPTYDPKSLKNNLAILRLERVIKFHKKIKNVKKIRVDTNAWALPSNTDGITIIGWGARTKSNKIYNPSKNKLAMAVLYFYGLADCRDVYSKDLVTKKNFCAGFISRGGGACNRDVGAPGVVNGILAGVVSFGSPNCGERDSPTVFTKLGYYIDWIEDIMSQDPPKQSVRITTRRPHLFHTIMSTRPSHESNFLIEPIDLSKVPDIRDLDVRMPQEDKNEFINNEFNSIQPVSRQTFTTSKQIIKQHPEYPMKFVEKIIKQHPEDPMKFVDITRLRDENGKKVSSGTTYESPRLDPIFTVMGDFDDDEILPSSNGIFAKTSTIADLLAQTRAQNKELKKAAPQWQTAPEHAEDSESVEDTTEVPDDTRESTTTHNFQSKKTPLNVVDNIFKANHSDAEKLLSSDDYDDDNETLVVQQSLPVHPISKEKYISIQTPKKAIANEKKREVSHKVQQPVKSPKEQDLDNQIDKFIENLDLERILLSEEELNAQVLSDNEFPKQHKNQEVTPVPVKHKRYSLQGHKTKPALKNDDMFPLRDLTPKDDNFFPLQDHKTKPAPKKYYLNQQQDQKKKALQKKIHKFPLQDEKTETPPKISYTFPLQDVKTEPAQSNDYMYPQQDQEAEPAPMKDHIYPQQDQEIESSPKNYHMFPLQHQKTKPPLKKYHTIAIQDENTEPAPTNDYMYPQHEQETESAPTNDYKYPQQERKTKPAPKKYHTVALQDDKIEPAPTNDYMYPQQEQETESAPTNDYKFALQERKTKPAPKKYHTVALQDDNTETAPTNDYMYPQHEQETESAPTNDYKFALQERNTKPAPKKYYTVALQDDNTEPTPTNDYMYPQQEQETERAPTNDYKFPLQDQKIKLPPKNTNLNSKQRPNTKPALEKYNTVLFQDEETKSALKKYDAFPLRNPAPINDDIFPVQGQKIQPAPEKYNVYPQKYQKTEPPQNSYYTFSQQDEETESTPTNDYLYPQQDQEAEPVPMNDHMFPLQDQKTKPQPKKYYLNPQDEKTNAQPKYDFTFSLQYENEPAPTNDYMHPQQDQEAEPAPTNDQKFPLQDQKTKPQPKNDYMHPQRDQEAGPAPTNDHVYPLQDQKIKQSPNKYYTIPLQYEEMKPAPTHNDVLLLQDKKAKPAHINSYVPPLQKQDPKPALKGDDILTLLYVSDHERKPDEDSSPEALSVERKKIKDLTMNLVYDVITEELRKKKRE